MALETIEQTQQELILGFLAESGEDFTSGEALSGKLGLSRTAVWKHVESLRGKGYRIEAARSRGYRLVEAPDRLTSLELAPLLSTHDVGRTVHSFDSLPSTNEHAFRLAAEGADHGEVVVAEQQTAGKGRRGRAWVSPPGLNLYLSVILRPELPAYRAPELTLVAAVALAETLRESGGEAAIKWPNDVLLGGLKVAGILTELSAHPDGVNFVVLGLGVNLNAQPEHFPEEVRPLATSLAQARGQRVARVLFAARLLNRLEEWLDVHQTQGFEPARLRWRALSSTLGQDVRVRGDGRELRGRAEDIDMAGALLVRTAEGSLERVLAGDVEQLRPVEARRLE